MKRLFEKNETLITILLIVAYVVLNSYCMQNFGFTSLQSVLVNTAFSVVLIVLMIALGRVKYYGIKKAENARKYLYFIPLVLIASVNLWNGINITNTTEEIMFHILTMVNVGFIEEIIFRGFLFKMMEKDNVKSAVIVSSLTFGIGHIVNLLNGGDTLHTLMQILYAVALGYLFVMIFYKSKSLLPAILTHIVINCTSVFNIENVVSTYVAPIFMFVAAAAYGFYITKKVDTEDK